MTRPPFFAFYPADFAGDITVEAMTTLQVGAYILLLCKAWQADPPASLPNDDAVLARLARLTPAEWSEVKAGVLSPFSLGTDNRWHQKRLRQEYEKAKALIKDRAKAGRSGAQARWQTHGKRMTEPMRSDCDGNGIQSQSQNQKEKAEDPPNPPSGGKKPKRRRDPTATDTDPRFVRFWEAYPNKTKKPNAAKAFARLDPSPDLLDAILAGVERHRQSRKWRDGYVDHPATFLNQQMWDETPTSEQSRPKFQTHDDYVQGQMGLIQ